MNVVWAGSNTRRQTQNYSRIIESSLLIYLFVLARLGRAHELLMSSQSRRRCRWKGREWVRKRHTFGHKFSFFFMFNHILPARWCVNGFQWYIQPFIKRNIKIKHGKQQPVGSTREILEYFISSAHQKQNRKFSTFF